MNQFEIGTREADMQSKRKGTRKRRMEDKQKDHLNQIEHRSRAPNVAHRLDRSKSQFHLE